MTHRIATKKRGLLSGQVLVLAGLLSGCVEAVPPDLISAVESIDHDLVALHAAEMAPDAYAHFVRQWVPLKARLQSDDDLVRWPWESSDLETELRRLVQEGGDTVARLHHERDTTQRHALEALTRVEDRLQLFSTHVDAIDGRIVLGGKSVQADLLAKQARSFYDHQDYRRAIEAAQQAGRALTAEMTVLTRELGRYTDERRITRWRSQAQQTVDWSRIHQTSAIVVSKADRTLTLYKNGRPLLSYPVRLGFNGMREKQFQGDGATPEGRYRITAKRGQGQTLYYRALVLDYPNYEDRRRFVQAKKSGRIPAAKQIGGQIEIHGAENELMAQTLGCVMLDNPHMMAIYDRVEAGTPVTIVGALTEHNAVAATLTQLDATHDAT